ncbi:MAG TPA: S1 RNA-binding domain-containing protein [Terriglobales bacterium]|nr:S1 RNA-binding domain-containing protein [Terriglobales bacterium]
MTPVSAPPPPPRDPDAEPESTDFGRALEEFEKSRGSAAAAAGAAAEIRVGMKVKGRIVSVGEEHTLVDFGGRSEGVAETRRLRGDDASRALAPGDELELFVVEAGDQIVLAPSLRADAGPALAQVREAQAAGVPVTGRVTALNAGGLEVDLGGARGFCPVSQIEAGFCAEPAAYVGRTLEFLVRSVGDARGGVVLSRRQLLRREEEERARQLVESLKVGDEREGTVARLESFGAFVDLGGVDGLVHVSEIRHERTGHPSQALRVGEKVRVRVLRIDAGRDGRSRIALSIKAATPDPWQGIETRFTPGMRVRGVVARLADFGAFVTLAPGIDGLVHVSEASAQRVAHVKEVLAPGQEIEAAVLAVDPAKKRISLSIREVESAGLPPARTPAAGEIVEGRVAGIKPFGVFVDLPEYGPRVTGLLPREETGEPRGADLGRVFSVGLPLTVEVLEAKEGRIRLGLVHARPAAPEPAKAPSGATKAPEPELTTMAIALRKAMEEARRREQQGGSSS